MRARLADWWPIAVITAAAGIIRMSTLDLQSFDQGELGSVWLIRMSFGDMLSTLPETEAAPPLFYLVAWLWSHAAGSEEVGLRLLSGLFGTATVPLVAYAARVLLSRRAAIFASAVAALHPLLVWYSQDVRAYAILMFLSVSGFVLFLRVLDSPTNGRLAWWAIVSSLAICTHCYASFLIGFEALWLIGFTARKQAVLAAGSLPAAVSALLLPLVVEQHRNVEEIGDERLESRVVILAKQLLVGFDARFDRPFAIVAAAAGGVALWLVLTSSTQRDQVRLALAAGACAVAAPVLLALAGLDYVFTRYFVGALLIPSSGWPGASRPAGWA